MRPPCNSPATNESADEALTMSRNPRGLDLTQPTSLEMARYLILFQLDLVWAGGAAFLHLKARAAE